MLNEKIQVYEEKTNPEPSNAFLEKNTIVINIPLERNLVVSESNRMGEHWSIRNNRHIQQKFKIRVALSFDAPHPFPLPCKIKLIRIAPRELDKDDNLRTAFKCIKDTIADWAIPGLAPGRADGDKRFQWDYSQEKGKVREYAVRVEIVPLIK